MHKACEATATLTLAATSVPSAAEIVVGALLEEHRTVRTVLTIVERLLADIEQHGTEPDFGLLCTALYYLDDFPERVHHPKEDEYLFAALRRRTTRLNAVLDRLGAEHVRSPAMLVRVQRELVHYQGGAPGGLRRLRSAVSAYAAMLQEHMRMEEELFGAARGSLTEEDWSAISRAFQSSGDPLASDACRQEFRRLRARILTMLPRKMRIDAKSEIMRKPGGGPPLERE